MDDLRYLLIVLKICLGPSHSQNYRGTVIAVTHDRYFLDNVAAWILEIDRGQALPFEGGYGDWLEAKRARLNLEQKADAVKAKVPHPLLGHPF